MEVQVQREKSPVDWDQAIASVAGGFGQSTTWANISKRADRVTPIYLQVYQGKTVIASLVLHERYFHRHRERGLYRTFAYILKGNWPSLLEWIDGPIFHTNNPDEKLNALECLLEWLDAETQAKKHASIQGSFNSGDRTLENSSLNRCLQQHGYTSHLKATILVDLSRPEEQLWKDLQQAARKSVNKARRQGLAIRMMKTREEVKDIFYASYVRFERQAGRSTTPPWVLDVMWDEDPEKLYSYFVAEDPEGNILGTLGIHCFDGMATEIASSMSTYAHDNGLPAQDLLHWEVMLFAKQQGARSFDLAGIEVNPSGKATGIRRFKEKWGGQYSEYLGFSKTFRPTFAVRLSKAARMIFA